MLALVAKIKKEDILNKALVRALFVGALTILIVLNIEKSNHADILEVAKFLSNTGNTMYLVIWAWRRHLSSVIKLTFLVDIAVLILVQGTKFIDLGSWNVRPNGGTHGFPSGHTTHAFSMAFLLSVFFPRFTWLWYVCGAAISWSRLETNAHYGFQITVGVFLGIAISWTLVNRWLTQSTSMVIESRGTGVNE